MIKLGDYLKNKERIESEAADKKKAIFDEMLSYFNEKIGDIKKSISDMEDTLNYISEDHHIIETLKKLANIVENKKYVRFCFAFQSVNRIKPTLSSEGVRLFYKGFIMTKKGIVFNSELRDISNIIVDKNFPEVISRYFSTSRCGDLLKNIKYLIDTFNESIKGEFFEIISNCIYISGL